MPKKLKDVSNVTLARADVLANTAASSFMSLLRLARMPNEPADFDMSNR